MKRSFVEFLAETWHVLAGLGMVAIIVAIGYNGYTSKKESNAAYARYVQNMESTHSFTVRYYLPDKYATVQVYYTNSYELVGSDGVNFTDQNGHETFLKGSFKITRN